MNNSENFEVHTMNDLRELGNSNENLKNFSPLLKNEPGINNVTFQNNPPIKSGGLSLGMILTILLFFLLSGLGVLAYLDYVEKIAFINFIKKEEEIVEPAPEVTQPIINEEEEVVSKSLYSEELSNYLLVDVESEDIVNNIKKELDIIRTNLPEQKFSQPISFIVTNKNSQPISFGDFSVYANMNIPSDILLALDDKFEIYVYDDFETGVRFGLKIEIKNEVSLNKALETNYQTLPNNFSVFFNNFTVDPTKIKAFSDSDYKTYKIKYLNLDEAKTYSVDYTIDKNNWIIGTSKKTLRAILDKLDKGNSTETNLNLKQNSNLDEMATENTSLKN